MLVGDGSLRQQLESLIDQNGIRERVWLAGSVENVPQLLEALDVFVLPSLAEGVSNTILEAMATGLPVVATRVGANADLVVQGETGLLVPRADPESMTQALDQYTSDDDLRARHGEAGRRRAVTEFSIMGMTNRYLNVYDEVCEQQS